MSSNNKNIRKIISFTTNYGMFQRSGNEEFEYKSKETVFDEAGNTIKEVRFLENGDEDEAIIYLYDDKNRLVAETVFFELSESEEKRVIKRNDADKTEEEIIFYGDEPGEKVLRKLDEKGNVIESTHFDEDGNEIGRTEYTYTSGGKIATEKEFDEDGNVIKSLTNEYDEKGYILKQKMESDYEDRLDHVLEYQREDKKEIITTKDLKGNVQLRVENEYDEKDNLIRYRFESIIEPLESRIQELEYDENGKLISNKVKDLGGNLIRHQELEYDEEGFLVEEVTISSNPLAGHSQHARIRYEYELF